MQVVINDINTIKVTILISYYSCDVSIKLFSIIFLKGISKNSLLIYLSDC